MRRVSNEPMMSCAQPAADAFANGTIKDERLIPAYTLTARVLHWITAVLILTIIPLGGVIPNEWGGAAQDAPYDPPPSIGLPGTSPPLPRGQFPGGSPPLPLPPPHSPTT